MSENPGNPQNSPEYPPTERWELKVSEKPWDSAPFENEPPISAISPDELLRIKRIVPPKLLLETGVDSLEHLVQRDKNAIPAQKDREGYAPFAWRYWASGCLDYLKVISACQRHQLKPHRIFDFGCATGRVLRHFVAANAAAIADEKIELWGSDLNYRHIRWLESYLPEIKAVFNPAIPSLPIEDNFFDLVTAFSVFTHLDTFESTWLCELRRVLRPGGMAYLTIHNEATWEDLRTESSGESGALSRHYQSLVAADTDINTKLAGDLPAERMVFWFNRQGPYGSQVFHATPYIQRVWGRFFEILEILPRHHFHQAVVVMRKPT
ncbi:MAG: class I SAM-dependent methyltransferase [Pirellulaceae bacterium]|nr:class I SAM-dependent methyltransferase [Pirellulaceae bacterium]